MKGLRSCQGSYPAALLLHFKPLVVLDSLDSISDCFADTLCSYSAWLCIHTLRYVLSHWGVAMSFLGLESVCILK